MSSEFDTGVHLITTGFYNWCNELFRLYLRPRLAVALPLFLNRCFINVARCSHVMNLYFCSLLASFLLLEKVKKVFPRYRDFVNLLKYDAM